MSAKYIKPPGRQNIPFFAELFFTCVLTKQTVNKFLAIMSSYLHFHSFKLC